MLERAMKQLPAGTIAKAMAYAIEQSPEVDVNEITVRLLRWLAWTRGTVDLTADAVRDFLNFAAGCQKGLNLVVD